MERIMRGRTGHVAGIPAPTLPYSVAPILLAVLFLVLCAVPVASRAASVVINEFMAYNTRTLTNKLGDCSDWIELYNTTSSNIDLTGWYLTDDPAKLKKWAFPSVNINGYGYLLVWADSYTDSIYQTEIHTTNISLSYEGEYLALVGRNGTNVVYEYSPSYPKQAIHVSYGIRPGTSNLVLVADGSACRYQVPQDGSAGTNWISQTGFDDSGWAAGQVGIGYETGTPAYAGLIRTQVPAGTTGVYVRLQFDVPGGIELASLKLKMKYDDGFVAYINGTKVTDGNAPVTPLWNSPAAAEQANELALENVEYDISQYMTLIVPGTNILAVHLMNYDSHPEGSDLLAIPELVLERYASGVGTELRYFHTPTPMARNVLGANDYLEEVGFSVASGYYEEPFYLALTNNIADSVIRYTLDCSIPNATNGVTYTNVFLIDPTRIVRATALKAGYELAPLVTRSYISLADALNQPTNPPGFPPTALYGMNREVMSYPEYAPQLTNAFMSLPMMSLVSPTPGLFGTNWNGIYYYYDGGGYDWERPASLELVNQDGTDGFLVNCGIRITGRYSRTLPKKSFRAVFRNKYGGSGKLKYRLFSDAGAADAYDDLVIGARGSSQFSYRGNNCGTEYLRNQVAQDLQLKTGHPSAHFTYVHLFINGLYWGVYSPMERPTQAFAASYGGGKDTDWDAVHDGLPTGSSSLESWNAMHSQMLTNIENYSMVQGNNPDGTPNPAYTNLLDMDNYIDYLLVNIFLGNCDWPSHNYYAVCGRDQYRTGFKYFCWDADGIMYGGAFSPIQSSGGAAYPYAELGLRTCPEFKLLFADHVYRHFYNGGPMDEPVIAARFDELSRNIEKALIVESARWGILTGVGSLDNWRYWRDYHVNTYFPERTDVVLGQCKYMGLYPLIDPPQFSRFGGVYTSGFALAMSTSNTIWYTLDGTDPRRYGTGEPIGITYTNPVPLTGTVAVKARARGMVGGISTWSALAEAWFTPAEESQLKVSELMYNPAAPATNSPFKRSDFEFVELWNSGTTSLDLKHAKVTEGIDFEFTNTFVLAPNAYCVLVANAAAFTSRYGTAGITIAGQFAGSLDDNGEQIRIKSVSGGETLVSLDYSDGRGWPLSVDGAGHSLVPDTMQGQSNGILNCGINWRASSYIGGSPGAVDPAEVRDVVLNELVVHTDYTNVAKPEYDSNDWIEMYNTTAGGISLSNWYLSDNMDDLRKWAVPATNLIAAHEWKTFDEVSGFHSPITNGFGLSKDGEQVFLSYLPGVVGQDRVADCLSFKGQLNGTSFGRYTDGSDYWYELTPTTNAANALPGTHVVISEIMYHPAPTLQNPEDNQAEEYVELQNPLGTPVQMWGEDGTPWRMNGGIEYDLPTNIIIGAGESALLLSFDPHRADALAAFKATYGITNAVQCFGPYRGRLSNEGERIALERSQLADPPNVGLSWVIVDEVSYFDKSPWPTGTDASGNPLQRLFGSVSGMDPANWSDVFAPSPGMWKAKLGLSSPQNGTGFILPFSVKLVAAIDMAQVAGGIARVEFYEGTNLLGTVTNMPFEFNVSGLTNVGSYAFFARMIDGDGTNESKAVTVYTMRLDNGSGASSITDISARFNGRLTGNGEAAMFMYWGLTDGGTDKAAWAHAEPAGIQAPGTFSSEVFGLSGSMTYYYRLYGVSAQGKDGWAGSTASFTTLSLNTWSNRAMITFSGYNRAETLNGFPALVILGTNIPGFSYSQMAFTNASDLRFTDANRLTMLNFEIDKWDTNGLSYVWVQLPRLSSAGDYIYAYWGNTNAIHLPASTEDGSVWSANHWAVWHLNPGMKCAMPGGATPFDTGSQPDAGVIGDSRRFDGDTNKYIISEQLDRAWYDAHQLGMTVSMWVKPDAGMSGAPFGAHGIGTSRTLRKFHIACTNGLWDFGLRMSNNTEFAVSEGQWQMVTMALDNRYASVYKNGRPAANRIVYTNIVAFVDFDPVFGFMNGHSNAMYGFEGSIDEIRVVPAVLSSNWIWATWINVASNTPFISYGNVTNNEAVPDADGDGMVDEWETRNFSGVNEPGCGPHEDKDSDGYDNLYEYIAGTDPTNALDYLYIELFQDADKKLGARYWTREATGTVYLGMTRYYGLENASNLPAMGWAPVENCTNITGSGQVDITNLPPDPAMFYRVKVNLR